MQEAYSNGCFGVHQVFPEAVPIVPLFEIPDDLQVFWILSSTSHLVPSTNPSTRPSLLLMKNLWEPNVGLPGWPRLKLLEPALNGNSLFSKHAVDIHFKNPINGMYAITDMTADPLGGGFLATVISMTPMPVPNVRDREVPVYHHVYFTIEKCEDGRAGYYAQQRAVIGEQRCSGTWSYLFSHRKLFALKMTPQSLIPQIFLCFCALYLLDLCIFQNGELSEFEKQLFLRFLCECLGFEKIEITKIRAAR